MKNRLTPFRYFCMQNFPFIEATFDAIDNYGLLCKIVEYLNTNITKTNELGTQVQNISDYFNTLDVQDEINKKLDEMAESGELTDIIAQYLQLAGLLCFNTLNDLKNAQNLSNGSFTKTFGTNTYNDGNGNFYKIREIINTDVIDNVNLIALTNYPNLIAELIKDKITEDIELLTKTNMIMLGDSFGDLNDGTINRFFYDYIREGLGLTANVNFFAGFQSGAGFVNGLYLANLQNIAQYVNKETITDIFICGGWNDTKEDDETYNNQVELFNTYVKQNFPNAKITIAHISWGNPIIANHYEVFQLLPISRKRYINTANKYGYRYLTGVENILHDYTENLWQADGTHPSQAGQELLGTSLIAPFLTGSCSVFKDKTSEFTPYGLSTSANNILCFNYLQNDYVKVTVAPQSQNQPIIIDCNNTQIANNGSNGYYIGKLNSPYLAGFSSTNAILVPVVLYGIVDGSDNSFNCMCALYMDKGVLTMKPMLIASKQFKTMTLSKIVITDFSFNVPSIIA